MTTRFRRIILTGCFVIAACVTTLALIPHHTCACGPKVERSLLIVILESLF